MYLTLLQNAISNGGLVAPGDLLLVAVSGGADSVSLLLGLNQLIDSLDIKLAVVHLNHGLRGDDADADAEFVEALSAELGLPFYSEQSDVKTRAENDRISLEMAARAERYEFFIRAAEHFDTKLLATAHTADDQAETVLLKLARGAGVDGLSGIASKSDQSGLTLIRPLLNISRKELIEFLKEKNQTWREDLSNSDTAFLRNRVRHDLLPWLKNNLNSAIKKNLCRTATILRDEHLWLDELCQALLEKCRDSEGSLNVKLLQQEPVAARRRVLRLWLSSGGIAVEDLNYRLIESTDELLCRATAGSCSLQLPHGSLVIRQYDMLILETCADSDGMDNFCVELSVPGEVILAEQVVRVIATVAPGIAKKNLGDVGAIPAKASISLAAVGDKALYVRSWREGDRMKPLGIDGTQKLQDIFVNEKVPLRQRADIAVVECGGEIVWIPNFRVARGWEVGADDAEAVQLEIVNNE